MSTVIPSAPGHPVIGIRLSLEEKARFKEAAAADGKKSLGTWMKALARKRIAKLERRGALRAKEGGADD
jgi:hypothetical protein